MASPADLARLAKPDAKYEEARRQGFQEGRSAARKEILDYLEGLYRDPTIERGSVEGKAILGVASKVSKFFSTPAGSKKQKR